MWFWLTILVGLGFAALGIKIGFFEVFAAFFNCLVAVFTALFVTPWLLRLVPQAADMPAGVMFTTLVVCVAVFLFLFALCYFLITGQFSVPFPKVFDVVFAGSLGFLMGLLVISFLLVLLSGTPLPVLGELSMDDALAPNVGYLCWWNDSMHRFVAHATPSTETPTREAIARLRDLSASRDAPLPPADPNRQDAAAAGDS